MTEAQKTRFNKTKIRNSGKKRMLKEYLYRKQQGKCNRCNEQFPKESLERDHIIPIVRVDDDSLDTEQNQQLLCHECHIIKTKEDEVVNASLALNKH